MFDYTYDMLMQPTLDAIKALGGSATISEINSKIIEIEDFSEEQVDDIHRGSTTKLEYRSAWARTYLKKTGYLVNSARGVWSTTEMGNSIETLDVEGVKREAKRVDSIKKNENEGPVTDSVEDNDIDIEDTEIDDYNWQNEVLDVVKSISPVQFERLCQRLLRELGFVNVEVTQATRDDGIDGKGILKLGKVLSFHVVFQAKRYDGSVGTSAIRDFRGAMIGRADKGLIITTGSFTTDAKREARRDGATPIDLINGNDLAEHLKQLGLGITTKMVEKIEIDSGWYASI